MGSELGYRVLVDSNARQVAGEIQQYVKPTTIHPLHPETTKITGITQVRI
jgi:hypothetical protein